MRRRFGLVYLLGFLVFIPGAILLLLGKTVVNLELPAIFIVAAGLYILVPCFILDALSSNDPKRG